MRVVGFDSDFNPRSPCGERRDLCSGFLLCSDFNPRSPCGERRRTRWPPHRQRRYFNPRSPCGERRRQPKKRCWKPTFQSTLPVWGATRLNQAVGAYAVISIHAPRVGSDVPKMPARYRQPLFQSTLPVWGATRPSMVIVAVPSEFQSTLPVWGATLRHGY